MDGSRWKRGKRVRVTPRAAAVAVLVVLAAGLVVWEVLVLQGRTQRALLGRSWMKLSVRISAEQQWRDEESWPGQDEVVEWTYWADPALGEFGWLESALGSIGWASVADPSQATLRLEDDGISLGAGPTAAVARPQEKYCTKQSCLNHEYTLSFGCSPSDLGLEPLRFDLRRQRECAMLVQALRKRRGAFAQRLWVEESVYSTRVVRGAELVAGASKPCSGPPIRRGVLSSLPIRPARFDGHRVQLRTWALVASTSPLVLYFHTGFAYVSQLQDERPGGNATRSLQNILPSDDVKIPWSDLSGKLVASLQLEPGFLAKTLEPRMEKITEYVVRSLKLGARARGRRGQVPQRQWQLLSLDWDLDVAGATRLAKTALALNSPRAIVDLGSSAWQEALLLVAGRGDVSHNSWRLVVDDSSRASVDYNPCKVFSS